MKETLNNVNDENVYTCQDCRFISKISLNTSLESTYVCRYNPPTLCAFSVTQMGQSGMMTHSAYPTVTPTTGACSKGKSIMIGTRDQIHEKLEKQKQ